MKDFVIGKFDVCKLKDISPRKRGRPVKAEREFRKRIEQLLARKGHVTVGYVLLKSFAEWQRKLGPNIVFPENGDEPYRADPTPEMIQKSTTASAASRRNSQKTTAERLKAYFPKEWNKNRGGCAEISRELLKLSSVRRKEMGLKTVSKRTIRDLKKLFP